MHSLRVSFQNNCTAKADELVRLQSINVQQLALKDAEMAELKAQLRLVCVTAYYNIMSLSQIQLFCNGF
jgi:hypothetical protein